MSEIAKGISEVISARRLHLPEIEADIGLWRRADEAVLVLGRALGQLCAHPTTPPEIGRQLEQVRIDGIRPSIARTVEQLQQVASRVGRQTVNIGVSGCARVGKSTLLQSISGLDDEQLPTGSGIPVTAVRSRIHHVPGHRRAVLDLHTFDSFRRTYLQPRHSEVGLPEAPEDVPGFRNWRYPRPGDSKHPKLLNDLKETQESLSSYEQLLERDSRTLELTAGELGLLRQYVAYPTVAEKQAGRADRKYLAVRDIRIECEFPHDDVGRIGICDLPGLGEESPDTEQHHVAGLKHEVDLVLIVKRAEEGIAFWGKADTNVLRLLDDAKGFVQRRRDFAFIVLNTGSCTRELVEGLRDDVSRNVNEKQDALHHHVLEVDARDPADVATHVLEPVLRHLVERLPVMDREILAGTRAEAASVRDELAAVTAEVKTTLRQIRGLSTGAAEELYRRAGELHKSLAVALHELLAKLREQALSPDRDYADAVEKVYQDVLAWTRSGLGVGQAEWCANAVRTMVKDGGSAAFATTEFNRVRVEISRRYSELDLFFQDRLDTAFREVAAALAGELGDLLGERTGRDALEQLAGEAGEAAEPCVSIQDALAELLALRLDYRTQIHPRVRPELDSLTLQVHDATTGHDLVQVAVPTNDDGAEELFLVVSELAEQAAYHIRTRLLRDTVLPGQVLFAAVEQFTDDLIRSSTADREVRQLARSYRDVLWPGVFREMDGADARVARVSRAADELMTLTDELRRTPG